MISSMNGRPLFYASLVLSTGLFGTGSNILAQAQANAARLQVPFVGCESDGQVGPLEAPKGKGKLLAVPKKVADRLAYYQAEEGFGVLAPRGWHCFSTYGSNGSTSYVTPDPINGAMLFASDWKGFTGQAVQVSVSVGDTSGRFEVARTIARVFPDKWRFVQDVIAEGIEPASSFPPGPYPADKMTYRTKKIVEFETPPNSKGLGTDSMLLMNASPIRGVAILFGEERSLVQASARLAGENEDLSQVIVRQLEKEATESEIQ